MADINAYPAIDLEKLKAAQDADIQNQQQTQVKQAATKKQAAVKQTKQKDKNFEKSLVNPLAKKPQTGGAVTGLAKFIEEKISIPAADAIDNLQGNKKTPDQIANERKQQRATGQQELQQSEKAVEQQAYSNPVSAAGTEVIRAGVGALAKPVEGAMDVGYQWYLNNTVNKGKNPGDEGYKRAYIELTKAPKTELGQAGEKILSFVLTARALSRVPGAKLGSTPMPAGVKGAGWLAAKGKRLVTEGLVPGAIADFFLTDAKDGNMLETVKGLVPEDYRESFVFGLATDKYGDPLLNRVYSLGEGAVMNPVFNAGLEALATGYKAARNAIKGGATKDEAVVEGLRATAEKSEENIKVSAKESSDETNNLIKVRNEQINKLDDEENVLREKMASLDPNDTDEVIRQELELENLNQKRSDLLTQNENDLDPTTKYEPFENTSAAKSEDINKVAATQLNLEEGFPGVGKVGVHGASGRTMTDAAIKSVGLEDTGAEKWIRNQEKSVDVLRIAKESGMTVGQVLRNASRISQDFYDSLRSYDEIFVKDEGSLVKRLMGEAGEIITGSKNGTLGATSETLIAVKAVIADFANQGYQIAKLAEDADTSQVANFNFYDRLVDRTVGLLEFYKTGTQMFGGSLNNLKLSITKNLESREAAQLLESFEMDDPTYSLRQIRKWAVEAKDAMRRGDADGLEKMRSLARALVLAGGDPSKSISFAKTARDMWFKTQTSNFYNSLLSGAKTIFRNGGTVYRLIEGPTSIALAGAWKGDDALLRSGLAGYSAMWNSSGEAMRVAMRTIRTGIPASTTPKRIIEKTETLAKLETLETLAETPSEAKAVAYLKWHYRVAEVLDFPSKLLMGMDDYMKTILVRQRVAELATYQAMKEAPGNPEKYMAKYLDQYKQAIDPQTGTIKNAALREYAEIGTFQSDPGAMINHLSASLEKMPFGRIAVPFLRTPANIIMYQFETLPFTAQFSKNYQKAMKSGDPLLVAEYEGRQAVGLAAVTAAGSMAAAGKITGNWPIEPEERKRWKELGIRPRSLVFGDQYISYQMVEPLSNIIAGVADAVRIWQVYGMREEFIEKMTGQMGLAIAAGLTEKSYFSGIAAMTEVADPQNWTSEKATRGLISSLNSQMYLSGMRRGFANTFDDYQREYSSELDRQLQTAVPGYRNFRPSMISVFTGKPMKNPNGGLWNANVPFEISLENKDSVVDNLQKVGFKWKDDLEKHSTGILLTAEDKNFIRTAMHEYGVRDRYAALMNTPYFKEDLANWEARKLGPNKEYFNSQQPRVLTDVQQIWTEAREYAFNKLAAKEGSTLGEQLQTIEKQKGQFKRGNYQAGSPQKTPSSLPDTEAGRLERLMQF